MDKNVVLKRMDFGYWPEGQIELQEHFILAHYLFTDVGSGALSWIEWLNDPQYSYTSSNATSVIKDPDDVESILLADVLSDDGPYFVINKNTLINLLEKWDELYKQGAPYIVITIDGDTNVTIEGAQES